MKSYFLCLRKKDSDTLQTENIVFSAAESIGLKKEDCLTYSNAREFFFKLANLPEEESLVILAVDNEFFVNAKRMVCSVLSIKCEENQLITDLCKPDAENLDVHSSMPVDGVIFPTEDGLFSGFAIKTDHFHLAFLPLDPERTAECLEPFKKFLKGFTQSDDNSNTHTVPPEIPEMPEPSGDPLETAFGKLQAILSARELGTSICVPPAGEKICSRLPEYEKTDFFVSPLKRGSNSPKTYAALLAKEAAERSSSNIGAGITRAFKTSDNGKDEFFIIVAVADSEYAKIKKIYAAPQETAASLTQRAVETAFAMLGEYITSKDSSVPTVSSTVSSGTTTDTHKKSSSSKNKKMLIAGICAAVIVIAAIALGAGYFMARANDNIPASSSAIKKDYEDPSNDHHGEVGLIPETVYEDIADTQSEESSEEVTETESDAQKETETREEPAIQETTTEKVTVPTTKEPTTSKPVSDGTFLFTVYGYGHGVGMSQYGANSFAKQGWSYDKILTYYYQGTSVVDDPNMPKTLKVNGKDVETSLAVAMAVQGEMGSSFHSEALKAQAVAIYTYAMRNGGSCSGLYTVSNPSQTVINAVNAVKGKYVSYNGTYINAVFFAYSGGNTVSSSSVWGSTVNYPYLVSVDSSSDLKLSNCKTQVRVSAAEMKKRAYDSYGVVLTGDPSTWLKIQSHDNSTGTGVGYVSKISMGGKVLSGNQFRTYVMDYDIRSHCFSVEFIPA